MRGSCHRNGHTTMRRHRTPPKLLLLVLIICLLLVRDVGTLDTDGCNAPLGMESRKIKDSAISASSAYDASSVGPQHGRLHNAKNGGAWCPRQMISRDSKEYLEVDLEEEHVVTAVHTQGRFGNGQGQEYAEGYMVDYWRAGMAEGTWKRWKNRVGKQLLTGNTDTYSIVEQKLDPPIIASKIRFLPYSDHVRTVCMRVEILGCQWTEGILSYSMPQGVKVSSDLDFTDRTYDGVEEMSYLSDGLGQLVDGKKGKDNFNIDISGFGRGYEWVGWRNDTVGWTGVPLEITFEFDKVRNFSAAYLHTNNLFTSDVQVFSHARVFFSTNGHSFSPEPVHFSYMPDLVMEHSRNVTIKLHHRFGRFLKIQLYFASKWILLSEVAFDSAPASGNFTDLIEDEVTLLPAGPEYPPQRDEVKSTTSKVANLTISQSKTDGRTDEPESYVGFIVGALTVVILILVAAIAIIAFRNQRVKTIAGLTAIPTVRSDLECEKAAIETGTGCKPKESSDRPELYDLHVAHHQHTISPDYSEVPDVVAQEYAVPAHKLASQIENGEPPPVPDSLLMNPPPVPPPPKGYYSQRDVNGVTLPPSPPMSPTVPSLFSRCSLKDHFMLPLSPEPEEETASADGSSSTLEEESHTPIQRFPREKFRIVDKIGEGHFGDVHLCEMLESPEDAPNKLVVLHTLKVDTFRDQFVQEVKALARLKDANVSRLLGASLDEEPLYAVREYGVMGDLCQFLQDHVAETATPLAPIACALSYGCLIFMAMQIASGMKHMENLKYVHKDLAARNCLVDRGYDVKISDLGSYREMYSSDYCQVGGSRPLPIRWMSWESILLGKYTSKSDVWSFAVLLWEILTFAREQPFEELSDRKVIENITHVYHNDGQHVLPSCPINCPKEIYDLMCECWQRNEALRPSFREIHLFLQRKSLGYAPTDVH